MHTSKHCGRPPQQGVRSDIVSNILPASQSRGQDARDQARRDARDIGADRPLCLRLTRWRDVLLVRAAGLSSSRPKDNFQKGGEEHPYTVHRFSVQRYPLSQRPLPLIISSYFCDYSKLTIAVQQPPQRCAEPSKHARQPCPEPSRLPRATSSPTAL
jgi:hypothetical protein